MKTSRIVGQRVQQQRHGRWSQGELATLLGEKLGKTIDPTTITRLEGGKRPVTVDELVALAEIFETSVQDLMEDPDVILVQLSRWHASSDQVQRSIKISESHLSRYSDIIHAWEILEAIRRGRESPKSIPTAVSLLLKHAQFIFQWENLTDHGASMPRRRPGDYRPGLSAFDLMAALSEVGVDGAILNRSWHEATRRSFETGADRSKFPATMLLELVLTELGSVNDSTT